MSKLKGTALLNIGLVFIHQIHVKSLIIYNVMLLFIAVSLGALPFIYITVGVSSTGIIQSAIEKTDLLIPANGRLLELNLADNKKVKRGEILLTIDGTLPLKQIKLLNANALQLIRLAKDVRQLIVKTSDQQSTLDDVPLYTGQYSASWQQYKEEFNSAKNARQQTDRIYLRYKNLYQKKVVTQAEFEQYRFSAEQAISAQQMVVMTHRSQWQKEASQYAIELRKLQDEIEQLKDQEPKFILKAGVNGSLQNMIGLSIGSYVYANQKIGEISPDSTLIAYCYVKPADVGLIKKGQTLTLKIDAFNFNQWGMLYGTVIEVSDDVILQNQLPYFKVRCRLNKQYLQLQNGYKGQIKKGMSFRANFIVARRSLYHLLSDKVEDWVNAN